MGKRSRGPTPRRPTPRELEGVPGTVEHGFREHPIHELPLERTQRSVFERLGMTGKFTPRAFTMGPCHILLGREPAGVNGELLWHMTISTPSRHPTWDEIKVARYRLMPHEICAGMLLPPPEVYVNVPAQDHVFQVWEVNDPRGQWSTG